MTSKAETEARVIVARRSGGVCEICACRAAVDWHHRLNRSQGGLWLASTGLDLCRACHDTIGAEPGRAYARGWLVRRGVDPAVMPAWLMTSHGPCYVRLTNDGRMFAVDLTPVATYLHAPEVAS